MSDDSEFEKVFEHLKAILSGLSDGMSCTKDEAAYFSLDTKQIMKNKKPLFFGAVKVNKNYVSYHLMPVYVFPELLSNLSPELRKLMQGKSCFNFKAFDSELFLELEKLSSAGYQRYQEADYI